MLTVLGGLAEFGRDLIRTRTGEGRARAIAKGVKMGRKPKLTKHQQQEAIRRRDGGNETLAQIAARPMLQAFSPVLRSRQLAKKEAACNEKQLDSWEINCPRAMIRKWIAQNATTLRTKFISRVVRTVCAK